MLPLKVTSARKKPRSVMQEAAPGMEEKPAPYSEQILTYSTALALTGRSAACAPLMATRLAAEPRIRLLTIFIVTSKLLTPYEKSYKVGETTVENHMQKNGSQKRGR